MTQLEQCFMKEGVVMGIADIQTLAQLGATGIVLAGIVALWRYLSAKDKAHQEEVFRYQARIDAQRSEFLASAKEERLSREEQTNRMREVVENNTVAIIDLREKNTRAFTELMSCIASASQAEARQREIIELLLDRRHSRQEGATGG